MKPELSDSPEQAVLVYIKDVGLGDRAQENADELEDALREVIEGERLGEFDGIERGPQDVIFFMYGPDAERLFKVIEEKLKNSPLCKGARVVIRYGEPGSRQREFRL